MKAKFAAIGLLVIAAGLWLYGGSGSQQIFNDGLFKIYSNVDTTRRIKFDAHGIATSTTRTIYMPDNDVNLGELGGGGFTKWDDIGNPDAADEIDFASYIIELNVEDFRIGDGGSNYVGFNGTGALSFAGTGDIDLPNDSVDDADINWGSGAGQVDSDDVSEGSTNLYQLTEEEVEDYIGGMLGGTETHISVDYQDTTNDIDFVVDPDSVAGSISAGSYADDSIQADDIDTINCGTNVTWDTTNDEIDVDDAFITNNAADLLSASADGTTVLIVRNTDGTLSGETYMFELQQTADGSVNGDFIKCTDAYGGTPATLFDVAYNGDTTIAGTCNAVKFKGSTMTGDGIIITDSVPGNWTLSDGTSSINIEATSVINSDLSNDAAWQTSNSITGGSFVTGGNIGVSGDADTVVLTSGSATVNGTFKITGTPTFTNTATTDTAPTPDKDIWTITNNADHDLHFALQAGSTADQRNYIRWNEYDGDERWVMGYTGDTTDTFILYGGDGVNTYAHFLQINPYNGTTGDTLLNSVGTGAVQINNYGEAITGSGGFEVYSGTGSPSLVFDVDGSGNVYNTGVLSNESATQCTRITGVVHDASNASSRLFWNEGAATENYGFSWIYAGAANPTLDDTAFTLGANALYLIRHDNSATGAIAMTVERSATGRIIFNDAQNDSDTIIRGDTDADLFYVNAGLDMVGISDSTPSYTLDVGGTFQATGNSIIGGTLDVTGVVTIGSTTADGTLKIYDDDVGGDATLQIDCADAMGTSVEWILPASNGTAGQVLEIASVAANTLTLEWDSDDGAAGGDSIQIDSVDVVDPDFQSGGDIDFIDTSNVVTANINTDAVDSEHYNAASIDHEHLADDVISGAAAVGTFEAGDTFLVLEAGVGLREADYTDLPGGSSNYITDNAADEMVASTDGTTELIIRNTDGTLAAETYLLELQQTADGSANGDFIKCTDAYGGTPATLFNVEYNGNVTSPGTIEGGVITEGGVGVPNLNETDWINADEMADADHGDVAWSSGDATVESQTVLSAGAGTYYVGFFNTDSGADLSIYTDGPLTYAQATGTLSATEFSGGGGSLTGVDAATGDAAVDFFGAGVDAVTDTTTCTDIEGTGLSITASVLNWSASGIAGHDSFTDFVGDEHLDWTASVGTIHTDNYIEQDTEVTNWIDDVILGASGALTIPTGQSLTIGAVVWDSGDNIDGEVIADNTIDEDSIDWGSGTDQVDLADIPGGTAGASTFDFKSATVKLPARVIFCMNLHDPDDGMDDIKIQFPSAMTITKVSMICTAGTNVVGRLYEVDGDGDDVDAVGIETSDWTVTTTETEDTSFNNATLDAGDYLQWDTTSVSGSVTNFSITVEGYET